MTLPARSSPSSSADCVSKIDHGCLTLLESLELPFATLSESGAVVSRSGAADRLIGSEAVWRHIETRVAAFLSTSGGDRAMSAPSRIATDDGTHDVMLARLTHGVKSAAFAAVLVPRQTAAKSLSSEAWGLTPREREIAELLSRGLATKHIASALGISEHTARHHLESVFAKLGVRTRTAAMLVLRG